MWGVCELRIGGCAWTQSQRVAVFLFFYLLSYLLSLFTHQINQRGCPIALPYSLALPTPTSLAFSLSFFPLSLALLLYFLSHTYHIHRRRREWVHPRVRAVAMISLSRSCWSEILGWEKVACLSASFQVLLKIFPPPLVIHSSHSTLLFFFTSVVSIVNLCMLGIWVSHFLYIVCNQMVPHSCRSIVYSSTVEVSSVKFTIFRFKSCFTFRAHPISISYSVFSYAFVIESGGLRLLSLRITWVGFNCFWFF